VALVASSITKQYGKYGVYSRVVIDDFSYTFEPGKLYVIKGVSGCGKTTLLNILGGLDQNRKGRLSLNGIEDVDRIAERVGYIFQQSLLIADLTVRDNLLLVNSKIEEIDPVMQKLGLCELYEKYPSQLSGGERQRIAVVRALITGVKIILADEPTASLDETNSEAIAMLLADLCNDGCTVIVATHEHYFDGLADEIIPLDYGKLGEVKHQPRREIRELNKNEVTAEKRKEGRLLLKLLCKRGKRQWNISAFVPAVLLAVLILMTSSITNRFEAAMYGYIGQYVPTDLFGRISEKMLPLIDPEIREDITLYYPYYAEEKGVLAAYYAEEEDSVLAVNGMLKYGSFPQNENEIIVSYEYAEDQFGIISREQDVVGRTVSFLGREFIIAGCLYSFAEAEEKQIGLFFSFRDLIEYDKHYYYIYFRQDPGPTIFLDYDVISEIGVMIADRGPSGSYDGLMQNETAKQELQRAYDSLSEYKKTGKLNNAEVVVDNLAYPIQWITLLLYLVLVICFMIACIFIRSRTSVELYYRSKEIGFLQIFKVGKSKLKKMILWEYLVRLIISVSVALLIYVGILLAVRAWLGVFLFFKVVHVLLIGCVLLLLYVQTLSSTVNKYLKKDVVELVRV